MHIEKNVCENLLGTLLGIPGESKDNINARLDLADLNIRLNCSYSQMEMIMTYLKLDIHCLGPKRLIL
jgi:hypothetical protein